jgi:hypothetical protein
MLSNAESIAAGPTHKNPQYCGTGTARCVKRRKSFATRSGRSMGSWKTCRRRKSSHGWPARQRECRGWSRQSCRRSGSHRTRRLRSRRGKTADGRARHGASEIKEYTRGISRWARWAPVDLVHHDRQHAELCTVDSANLLDFFIRTIAQPSATNKFDVRHHSRHKSRRKSHAISTSSLHPIHSHKSRRKSTGVPTRFLNRHQYDA